MALLAFGNQNSRIFKKIHWLGNFESIIGLYQLTSRCNYNPDFFHYKVTVPTINDVKKYKLHNHSFFDLMDERAIECLKNAKKENKNVSLLYSGGMDSVGIAISILRNFSKQEYDLVDILCTPQSYLESPVMFNILSKHFRIKYCNNFIEKYTYDSLLITGMQGDLLFGSNGWVEKAISIDENMPYMNYKKGIPILLDTMYPTYGDKLFDRYFPIVEESIIDIKTVSDFVYWFYFTQSYQSVYYAYMRYNNAFIHKENFDLLFNFYDWEKFQVWSLNNIQDTIWYKQENFKVPLKKYIKSFINSDYFDTKKKFPSYGEVIEGSKFNFGLTEDWEFLNFEDSLKYFKH